MTGWVFRKGKDVYKKSREDDFKKHFYNFIVKIIQNLNAGSFSLLACFAVQSTIYIHFLSLKCKDLTV